MDNVSSSTNTSILLCFLYFFGLPFIGVCIKSYYYVYYSKNIIKCILF